MAKVSQHWASPLSISGARRGAGALAVLAIAVGVRWALEPEFGDSHSYTAFYPAVIVSAYFFGPAMSIGVAVLAAMIGYWFFDHPALVWKFDIEALTTLAFFTLTCGVSIYFITGMRRALRDLALAHARAEDLARSHAGLFGELNERVTNHLQLVAALLQLQARDEKDRPLSQALAEASARTLLISRVHRTVAGDTPQLLNFDIFARQLVDAALSARADRQIRIEIATMGMELPLDQATSVAIVLLECLNARLQDNSPAVLLVSLRGDDAEAILDVHEVFDDTVMNAPPPPQAVLIEAMVEQLRGKFSFRSDSVGATARLTFPRVATRPPPSVTEHVGPYPTLH